MVSALSSCTYIKYIASSINNFGFSQNIKNNNNNDDDNTVLVAGGGGGAHPEVIIIIEIGGASGGGGGVVTFGCTPATDILNTLDDLNI